MTMPLLQLEAKEKPEPRLLRVSRRLLAAPKGQCKQVQAAQKSKEPFNAVTVL